VLGCPDAGVFFAVEAIIAGVALAK